MIHTVYIAQELELARKTAAGTDLPQVGLKIRTAQTIAFAFMTSGTVGAVDGWVSGKAVIKEKPTSPVLLIDATLDAAGTDINTRYNAVWTAATLDGPTAGALRQFMADETQPKVCWCEVEWIDAAGTHSVSFPITLIPTFNDPEDEAPDPAVAAGWPWLKAHAPEANGFTHNDETQTLGVAPHSHAIGDVTGLQGALDGKAATSHSHAIGDVTGLQGALDGKAATSHSHAIGDVTGLQGALDAKQGASTLGADTIAAVHAATSKTTPADNDEIGAADSAASYGLKKFTWVNIKAALKTYFDTLYAGITHASRHKSGGADAIKLDELAAPTDVTTLNATTSTHGLLPKLGGGTTNFLRADGTWAAPAGGGGSALVRGKGTLTGYAVGAIAATRATGFVDYWEWRYDTGTITINVAGGNYVFTVESSDPADGSFWIDSTSLSAAPDMANALYASVSANLSGVLQNITINGTTVNFETISDGSSATISISRTIGSLSVGSTNGADAIAASGGTQSLDIIAANGTKVLKPLRIWVYSEDQTGAYFNGCILNVQLRVGATNYPLGTISGGSFNGTELLTFNSAYNASQEWFSGRASAKLMAFLSTEEGYFFPVEGQVTIYAICEQGVT